MIRILGVILFMGVMSLSGFSQVAVMDPADAEILDSVTIYFDASSGDQGLMDFDGEVYAHTGLITSESQNDGDWKYVVCDWGVADDRVKMTREDDNLYSLSFQISTFYGIDTDETVLKLAFVFRNAEGSVSARNADGSDVFVALLTSPDSYVSHQMSQEGVLTIYGSENNYQITPWHEDMFHCKVYNDQTEESESYAVVSDAYVNSFDFEEQDEQLVLSVNGNMLVVHKEPLTFSWQRNNEERISFQAAQLNASGMGGVLEFMVSEEDHFYGTGSRAIPVDRRGYQLNFYNQASYGYSNNTQNLNISIPLVVSSKNYGLFFDNHYAASMDLASSGDFLIYNTTGGVLEYFIIMGDAQADILEEYIWLTGPQEIPPLWSLGYIQSRYGYESQAQAEEVVQQMRAADFPMDALVLDLYWFGNTNDMGDLGWDNTQFPDPEQMMEDFNDQGIKTILITEPYFTTNSDHYNTLVSNDYLATDASGDPYVLWGFWAGDAGLLDMTNASATDWMWQKYHDRIEEGVGGWWTDLAEPETHPDDMIHAAGSATEVHNIYNLEWQKMLFEKYDTYYPDERLFNLSRSGWAGMQRYNAFPWSGDIQRSFEGLQAQIPIMLGMSMSGVGYMHSDIGGFTGGDQDAELYTRWMQLGAFTPIMRAHGVGVPTEPIYYDDDTQDRVREMIQMRYQFIPYNYSLAFDNYTIGLPLATPMNFFEPENELLANVNDQFLWGEAVLVAPVVQDDQTTKEVIFPSGNWYDFYDYQRYEGDGFYTVEAPIGKLPLFIKEGSLLMLNMQEIMSTTEYTSTDLQVQYYLPEEYITTSRFYYYDDGITRGAFENGLYEQIALVAEPSDQEIALSLDEVHYSKSRGISREMEFLIVGLDEIPQSVQVNNTDYDIIASESNYQMLERAALWRDDEKNLLVKFPWSDTAMYILINRAEVGIQEYNTQSEFVTVSNPSPNPFFSDTKIEATVLYSDDYDLILRDLSGKQIAYRSMSLAKGRNYLSLSQLMNVSKLNAGIYTLTISNPIGRKTIRLVKM